MGKKHKKHDAPVEDTTANVPVESDDSDPAGTVTADSDDGSSEETDSLLGIGDDD